MITTTIDRLNINLVPPSALGNLSEEPSHMALVYVTDKCSQSKYKNQFPHRIILNFHDITIEEQDNERKACNPQQILKTIEFAGRVKEKSTQLYVASEVNNNRAAAMLLGVLTFYTYNPAFAISEMVRHDSSVLPNYWVVAQFDYILGLNGRLTTTVDDYLATGMVISPTGQTYESTWK